MTVAGDLMMVAAELGISLEQLAEAAEMTPDRLQDAVDGKEPLPHPALCSGYRKAGSLLAARGWDWKSIQDAVMAERAKMLKGRRAPKQLKGDDDR